VIELDAASDGARQHDVALAYTNWMATARAVLTLMTGWSLPDDIIDYAARVLRVRASLGESVTSQQLDDLLTMYEWAHAAAARGEP
jgi:hypothetical protein